MLSTENEIQYYLDWKNNTNNLEFMPEEVAQRSYMAECLLDNLKKKFKLDKDELEIELMEQVVRKFESRRDKQILRRKVTEKELRLFII